MSDTAPAKQPAPHIGAFVLETLTLGMYGEPRHTIREYVQNAFDSIRKARRTGLSSDSGLVTVEMGSDLIKIRDDGLGIPHAQAWRTLTSIGASRKDRQKDAGFRGIGRLAGMAYCDKLVFETSFEGEDEKSVVEFDCKTLRERMDPTAGDDTELAELLSETTTISLEDCDLSTSHYFEVRLEGLDSAPPALTDLDGLEDYLASTAPVDFDPDWKQGREIRDAYKIFFGENPDVIRLDLNGEEIFKPYGDTYKTSKGSADLQDLLFFDHETKDYRYWGWVGPTDVPAAITDKSTSGLRMRVRNIQVDGKEIFADLFSAHANSYTRFTSHYVGEFHVDPNAVIPNARRDGFEETAVWLDIKKHLTKTVCHDLGRRAYEESKAAQEEVGTLVEKIERVVERSEKIGKTSKATYDQVVGLMADALKLKKLASRKLNSVQELDDLAMEEGFQDKAEMTAGLANAIDQAATIETKSMQLIGQFAAKDGEEVEELKSRLRQQLLDEVLEIVGIYTDADTLKRIRDHVS